MLRRPSASRIQQPKVRAISEERAQADLGDVSLRRRGWASVWLNDSSPSPLEDGAGRHGAGPRGISPRLMTRRRPHLFVFHNCGGGFNYAFLSKVALITAAQLRRRWNVNGTLSTRAAFIGRERAKRQGGSFPYDSNNKPKRKSLKGTNEQMVAGIAAKTNRPPSVAGGGTGCAPH